jgi:dATP pyrophosphohydrolase
VLLQTSVTVPVTHFADRDHWDAATLVIPVSHYAVTGPAFEVVLSHEHSAYQWLAYEEARALVKWDSDRTALWEIKMRFLQGRLTLLANVHRYQGATP